jgi:hypothetical protein
LCADGHDITRKDIDNVQQAERRRLLQERTDTQAALMMIAEDPRSFGRFSVGANGRLRSFFFSPNTSAQFIRGYKGVVMLDATYKSNRLVRTMFPTHPLTRQFWPPSSPRLWRFDIWLHIQHRGMLHGAGGHFPLCSRGGAAAGAPP